MLLEGVTTCVDYSDFLEITLPRNVPHFDKLVVVTAEEDVATQEVCERHGATLKICPRERLQHQGGFNKGCAINDGLRELSRREWVAFLDADIALPEGFRAALEAEELDVQSLYGMERVGCLTWPDWERYLESGEARPMAYEPGVGYFQLVHAEADRIRAKGIWYPEFYGHPELTDLLFSRRYMPHRQRVLEQRCVHLGPARENWRGRVSPPFSASD